MLFFLQFFQVYKTWLAGEMGLQNYTPKTEIPPPEFQSAFFNDLHHTDNTVRSKGWLARL